MCAQLVTASIPKAAAQPEPEPEQEFELEIGRRDPYYDTEQMANRFVFVAADGSGNTAPLLLADESLQVDQVGCEAEDGYLELSVACGPHLCEGEDISPISASISESKDTEFKSLIELERGVTQVHQSILEVLKKPKFKGTGLGQDCNYLHKYFCSFLNGDGGRLFFGVQERAGQVASVEAVSIDGGEQHRSSTGARAVVDDLMDKVNKQVDATAMQIDPGFGQGSAAPNYFISFIPVLRRGAGSPPLRGLVCATAIMTYVLEIRVENDRSQPEVMHFPSRESWWTWERLNGGSRKMNYSDFSDTLKKPGVVDTLSRFYWWRVLEATEDRRWRQDANRLRSIVQHFHGRDWLIEQISKALLPPASKGKQPPVPQQWKQQGVLLVAPEGWGKSALLAKLLFGTSKVSKFEKRLSVVCVTADEDDGGGQEGQHRNAASFVNGLLHHLANGIAYPDKLSESPSAVRTEAAAGADHDEAVPDTTGADGSGGAWARRVKNELRQFVQGHSNGDGKLHVKPGHPGFDAYPLLRMLRVCSGGGDSGGDATEKSQPEELLPELLNQLDHFNHGGGNGDKNASIKPCLVLVDLPHHSGGSTARGRATSMTSHSSGNDMLESEDSVPPPALSVAAMLVDALERGLFPPWLKLLVTARPETVAVGGPAQKLAELLVPMSISDEPGEKSQASGMRETLRRLALGSMLNPRLAAGSPGLVLKSRRPGSRGGSQMATPLPANVAAAVSRMMPEVSLPSYAPPAYY